MSDQPVIKGEPVEDSTPTTETTEAQKRTFPTKSFVKFALATTVAAVIGGYVVKKVTDLNEDGEEEEGWTIEEIPTTPEPTSD